MVEIPAERSPIPPADTAVTFLRHGAGSEVEFPLVGLRNTLRLRTKDTVGVGLWADEALIHLAAFRQNGEGHRQMSGTGLGMRRATWRFR